MCPSLQGVELELDGVESDLLQEDKDQERHRIARNGDHLMKVLFECEMYHYRNMNKQDPVYDCKKDEDTSIAIRRTQLDIFWARESPTMASNISKLRQYYIDSTTVFNLGKRVLPYLPSHIVEDRVGIFPGGMTLVASVRPGD